MAKSYPNSWYVEAHVLGAWHPISQSVGNKSYAMGYLNALDSFYPHPTYRLINNKGDLFEDRHGRVIPTPSSPTPSETNS